MSDEPKRLRFPQRYLDPADRLGEILFGVIMVLTVTLTAGLTSGSGKEGVHRLLLAAIGCNIAWGIIDGIMYIMARVTERSGQARLILAVQKARDEGVALDIIRGEVEPKFEFVAAHERREALYRSILEHAKTRTVRRVSVTKDDFLGALACFWLVFVSCLPAAVPFLIFSDEEVALRVSNVLMVAMLFIVGMMWGEYAYTSRIGAGLAMASIGLALVGVAILLGG
ncbi:MAG TPA: VIT family protein [Blastocatellia bacterium]|nr:VIT family protein [Blastocatellia bacterium]